MKRRRSLQGFQIKVEAGPVQICCPRMKDLVGAVHTRDAPYPTKQIYVTDAGKRQLWLVLRGSKFGGLPLHTQAGRRSWERAWRDNRIEVLTPSAGSWIPIEEWSEVGART